MFQLINHFSKWGSWGLHLWPHTKQGSHFWKHALVTCCSSSLRGRGPGGQVPCPTVTPIGARPGHLLSRMDHLYDCVSAPGPGRRSSLLPPGLTHAGPNPPTHPISYLTPGSLVTRLGPSPSSLHGPGPILAHLWTASFSGHLCVRGQDSSPLAQSPAHFGHRGAVKTTRDQNPVLPLTWISGVTRLNLAVPRPILLLIFWFF